LGIRPSVSPSKLVSLVQQTLGGFLSRRSVAEWCWTKENYYGGDRSGQNKS
jgi:hypothetical protein